MDSRVALVEFQGAQHLTIFDGEQVRVAMKPLVEALGIDWVSQYKRINRDPLLSEGMVKMTMPSERGMQETVTLPIDLMHGWLFTLTVSKVREDARERILAYQRECYQVLHDYWVKGQAINPRLNQIEHSDRTSRRRELPNLLDRMEKESHPEKRRVIHALIVKACEAEGIEPPALDAIAPPPEQRPEIAEAFFAALVDLRDFGISFDLHRDPSLLAIPLKDVERAAARHGIKSARGQPLWAALRAHVAFEMAGAVNCRDGKSRHCWVFRREKLPVELPAPA